MDSVSEKLQIFQPVNVDESIAREEWHTYHPFTKSFKNSDEIEIVINQQDVFMDISQAELYIEAKFLEEVSTVVKTGKCSLTNNVGAFLFESITYELNGKVIDKVRDPGLISTVKSLLCLNQNESTALDVAGWNWPSGAVKSYEPETDNFKGNKKADITILNIELRVKHIYPNDSVKLKLFEAISKDKPIFIGFRKWEIHELPALRQARKDVWTVKAASERARYVVVFFQEDRKDNYKADGTYFDNLKITDVKLYLNSEAYPYESLDLNFKTRQFTKAYSMYTDFQKSYLGKINSEPLLDFTAFASRALFVIDCSKQNEALKSNVIDVKLEFESSENFPENTRAFCIIIYDRVMEYLPLSGHVRTLI
ncbi:uncharacterized protein LOC115887041 [Sitophilus oryzae]|uniref:Uncharacterized protein LOC115887041 n=1 Tax=Sitophilus oryzae TaxID=7048 RepID=A0A6J2YGI7_SITOR|nr:uncharacterized protein LOC115887041 [Sitophilus oryzae]